ncbi:ABC transporter substrate-binding protein [Oceanicaulis alexandrii]|uniref:ABC transporter substrate-binding protein n=1 Tax=Oceanicaulis alexandrii TaxID=153233 RepID=UPI0035D0D82E
MVRAAVFVVALMVGGAVAGSAAALSPRVVSLDYCADQYVLGLADREAIAAVSTHADDRHSYLRAQAQGLPQLRDDAEDVLALAPDLIVRGYDAGGRASVYYQRLGLETFELGFASDFDDVEAMIRRTALALGQGERGEARIAHMRSQLARAADGPRLRALYMTPSGLTTGSGTLMHTFMTAAGFENIIAEQGMTGWVSVPLEQLHMQAPDVILAAFFDGETAPIDSWSASRHSVFRRMMQTTPVIELDAAALSCGAWFMADEALRARQAANALVLDLGGAES